MHNTFLVDFCNRSFGKVYGWVCNLTRWGKCCNKSCSYEIQASENAQKVRESLFLASILHQTSTSRQFTDGFFYVLARRPANKRAELTRRKNGCETAGEVCHAVMKWRRAATPYITEKAKYAEFLLRLYLGRYNHRKPPLHRCYRRFTRPPCQT